MNILYAITLTAIILFVLFLGLCALLIDDAEGAPDWIKLTGVLGVICLALLIAGTGIASVWVWLVP